MLSNKLHNPVMRLLGVAIALLLGSAMTVGASGLAQMMGRRIAGMSDGATEWGGLVRGSLAFSLACLVPIIGWMLFLPIVTILSMGAGIVALAARDSNRPPGD
jgi:hypothetical protein